MSVFVERRVIFARHAVVRFLVSQIPLTHYKNGRSLAALHNARQIRDEEIASVLLRDHLYGQFVRSFSVHVATCHPSQFAVKKRYKLRDCLLVTFGHFSE